VHQLWLMSVGQGQKWLTMRIIREVGSTLFPDGPSPPTDALLNKVQAVMNGQAQKLLDYEDKDKLLLAVAEAIQHSGEPFEGVLLIDPPGDALAVASQVAANSAGGQESEDETGEDDLVEGCIARTAIAAMAFAEGSHVVAVSMLITFGKATGDEDAIFEAAEELILETLPLPEGITKRNV
jgi:hypothetical protein